MKVYKIKEGIAIEHDRKYFLLKDENWDLFINDNALFQKISDIVLSLTEGGSELIAETLA